MESAGVLKGVYYNVLVLHMNIWGLEMSQFDDKSQGS